MWKKNSVWLSLFCFCPLLIAAQDNYEIQVYDSKLVPSGITMAELHSNYTLNGFRDTLDGVLPTHHALHETIEITHGFNSWMEIGFYQFLSMNQGMAPAYVGNHIRPRFSLPETYKCPVGLSLSLEFGYQDRHYATDSWTLELRPIIDKSAVRWYFSVNPVADYSLEGLHHAQGIIFSPNLKFSYRICSFVKAGLEYYNSMGPFRQFDRLSQQPHQLALAFDIEFSPLWELNFGYVEGFTNATEQAIFKVILGRKFGKTK
jgi:hypothetical protein